MKKKPESRRDLHAELRQGSFQHAVLCTYTFNARFFEDYCLDKFDTLSNTPNLTVLTDRGVYDEVILGAQADRPRNANIRYLLHPVSAAGVFHPKLFLFASKNRGRLILGSSNFTRPGITSYGELVGAFNFVHEEDEVSKPLFADAYQFLLALSERSGLRALKSNIGAIGREAPWLLEQDDQPIGSVRLVHNLEESIWAQIAASTPDEVKQVDILSLFFDKNARLLERVFEDLHPERIRIFTENHRTTLTEDWLSHPLVKDGTAEVHFLSIKDEGYVQPLHAKAICVRGKKQSVLSYGSANFTSAGLLRTPNNGNVETMILVCDPPAKGPMLDSLFDPCESAYQLVDTSELATATEDKDRAPAEKCLLSLREAEVVESVLSIDLSMPETLRWDQLKGQLVFSDDATETLAVFPRKVGKYEAQLGKNLRRRLDDSSVVLTVSALKGQEEIAMSNALLVTNLMEVRTGQSLRRARHVKEAQENVSQFFQVLRELLAGSDESALLAFFSLCDIPVLEAPIFVLRSQQRLQWDGGEGMRSLGGRNLTIYRELHDAALYFFDKHLRKLGRHVKTGSVRGVSNYLHIFFAMGGVLRSQVERLMQGLEAQHEPIDVETWTRARNHLNDYYLRVDSLMSCLYEEYLPNLSDRYGWSKVRKSFSEELKDLRELREGMIAFRERLEVLREIHLRVRTPAGTRVIPAYFTCVFDDVSWKKRLRMIEDLVQVEERLTA